MSSSHTTPEVSPSPWLPPLDAIALQTWRRHELKHAAYRRGPHSIGGGYFSIERRIRQRAETALKAVSSTSRVHGVGRPWLERADDACAFIMAGDSFTALACGAPGKPRRRGWGCYCEAHSAEMYRIPTPPRAAQR